MDSSSPMAGQSRTGRLVWRVLLPFALLSLAAGVAWSSLTNSAVVRGRTDAFPTQRGPGDGGRSGGGGGQLSSDANAGMQWSTQRGDRDRECDGHEEVVEEQSDAEFGQACAAQQGRGVGYLAAGDAGATAIVRRAWDTVLCEGDQRKEERSSVGTDDYFVASIDAVRAHLRNGTSTVLVLGDVRSLGARCALWGRARNRCADVMERFGDAVQRLFNEAAVQGGWTSRLPHPPVTSRLGAVLNRTHHVLVCRSHAEHQLGAPARNPGCSERHSSASRDVLGTESSVHRLLRSTAHRGGHCVLVLDELDVLQYPQHASAIVRGYLSGTCSASCKEDTHDDTGERVDPVDAKDKIVGSADMASHDGRWGAFHDVLSESEAELVWTRNEANETVPRWSWMATQRLLVVPNRLAWGGFMYLSAGAGEHSYATKRSAGAGEHSYATKRRGRTYALCFRHMALSVRRFGGRLNEARSVFFCFTEPGEERECADMVAYGKELGIAVHAMPFPEQLTLRAGGARLLKAYFLTHDFVQEMDFTLFVDLDTLVFSDPLPFLSPRHLRMHSSGMKDSSAALLANQTAWRVHGFDEPPSDPWYQNSGVISCPSYVCQAMGQELATRTTVEVESRGPWCLRDQPLFTVTYYQLRPPYLELPLAMNLRPGPLTHLGSGEAQTNVVIYHYKKQVDRSGVVQEVRVRGSHPLLSDVKQKVSEFRAFLNGLVQVSEE